MTFNPATSLFSTASGSKSLAGGGPLTPKSHESQANIIRPVPLRSRFFHGEDAVRPRPPPFKPWFDDNKENYVPAYTDKPFEKDGRTFGKMFGIDSQGERDKRCLRCYDKASFVLEPCRHMYFPHFKPSHP